MSKHSETLLYVLTEFLSKSIRSEAHVTEQSELKRIRSIREQKIEKCFEEFRATVQRAIDANQSLEQQADAYASQIRSDQTKRLKELHRSSKRTYDKLHNLFGITFARQHLSRQRVELKKLEEWSDTHALELKRSTSSRAENIKSIAQRLSRAREITFQR